MSPMAMYNLFKSCFPYYVPQVVKYKGDRETGGIDIFLKDGGVLTFLKDPDNKNGWILKGSNYATK